MTEYLIKLFQELTLTAGITALSASVAVLYNILNIIKYFRDKAIWDFFYIDAIGRCRKKNSFNPEYFVVSLLIVTTLTTTIVMFIAYEWISFFKLFLLWSGLSILIFSGSFLTYYIFSYYDLKKKIHEKSTFFNKIMCKSFLTSMKYSVLLAILLTSILIINSKLNTTLIVFLCMLCLIFGGSAAIFFEYNNTKILMKYLRVYDITQIGEETYCILTTINDSKYLLVKCEIEIPPKNKESKTIKLFLNTKLILPIDDIYSEKNTYQTVERYYNGEKICSRVWWYVG